MTYQSTIHSLRLDKVEQQWKNAKSSNKNCIKAFVTSNKKCKFETKHRQNDNIYLYSNFKCYISDTH